MQTTGRDSKFSYRNPRLEPYLFLRMDHQQRGLELNLSQWLKLSLQQLALVGVGMERKSQLERKTFFLHLERLTQGQQGLGFTQEIQKGKALQKKAISTS